MNVRRTLKARVPKEPGATKIRRIATGVVKRMIETKEVSDRYEDEDQGQIWNWAYGDVLPTGGTAQIYSCIPTLSEGDTEYTRTGVKVQPTAAYADLELSLNGTYPDITQGGSLTDCAWDITAHVWYGYIRKYKKIGDVEANAPQVLNSMFEDGAGGEHRFRGNLSDLLDPLNTEVVQMKHKSVRLYKAFGRNNTATLAGGQGSFFPETVAARMRLTFKPPKTLLYEENGDVPENFAPVCVIGYTHNDTTQASNQVQGANPPSIANSPAVAFLLKRTLKYKDA